MPPSNASLLEIGCYTGGVKKPINAIHNAGLGDYFRLVDNVFWRAVSVEKLLTSIAITTFLISAFKIYQQIYQQKFCLGGFLSILPF